MPARLLLYNIILIALGILTLPWVIFQLVFVKKRRQGLAHRFGCSPIVDRKTIWCHAVSVGEVRAVNPMLSLLQVDERTRDRIVLSTVTVTGQETANRECGFVSRIFYFPLDLPFVVGRSIRRVDPEIFITAETEIWPNFFNACFKSDIPVFVVNGRISDRSFSRYMRFRWFFRPVLEKVSAFLMQSEEDARRILEMGALPETVTVTGNMKYDRLPEPVSLPDSVKNWAGDRFLLAAGSTHAGEEETFLDVIEALSHLDILLALVPRHPERFGEVAELLVNRGLPFTKYSDLLRGRSMEGDILLVDAMGVLDGFYALADAAFVGGSLVPVGGHNLLEPAMHGIPVLSGSFIHNFRDISESLVSAGGCAIVNDGEELTSILREILTDDRKRKEMGKKSLSASREIHGASAVNVSRILDITG